MGLCLASATGAWPAGWYREGGWTEAQSGSVFRVSHGSLASGVAQGRRVDRSIESVGLCLGSVMGTWPAGWAEGGQQMGSTRSLQPRMMRLHMPARLHTHACCMFPPSHAAGHALAHFCCHGRGTVGPSALRG